VRVIAGSARGRRLSAPKGAATRPTSDLVRGAIFSTLASLGADLSFVLDLYAGSGALGIEALSRGAGHCDFVERNRPACQAIEKNVRATGFQSQAKVYCSALPAALGRLIGPYTLILADPPYNDTGAEAVLEGLLGSALARAGLTTLVWEVSSRKPHPPSLGPLQLEKTRTYGDTQVSIYR